MPRSILHKVTRKIVALKLALLESPKHKEIVRTLRVAACRSSGADEEIKMSGTGNEGLEMNVFEPEMVREVIIKVAAVSPSVYLDGLLSRIDDEDATAEEELAIVIHIAESETLGLAA